MKKSRFAIFGVSLLAALVPVAISYPRLTGQATQPSCSDDPRLWMNEPDYVTIDYVKARAALGTIGGYGGHFHGVLHGIGEPDKNSIYFKQPRFAGLALALLYWQDFEGRVAFRADVSQYNVLKGTYDFAQLYACKLALGERWQELELGDSISAWGIDEVRNRLYIGISGDSAVREAVRHDVKRISIPTHMVHVETIGRAVLD